MPLFICPKCNQPENFERRNLTNNPHCCTCNVMMEPAVVVSAAALAEARRPKTCAGCKWMERKGFMGNDYCLNENSPVLDFQQGFTITPDNFGCIHWEPAEPAPGSGGGE